MQSNSNSRRMSPFMLQSALGLTILGSLGLLTGLVLWLTNFTFGGRSFRITLLFPNAGGMTVGTRVAYRGVRVGKIVKVKPEPEGVALEAEIWPADRLIPANSYIEATQAGLVGETSIDIIPLQPLPPGGVEAKPLDSDCDPTIIICQGSRLQGEGKLDVNTLIRSLVRIANILSEPKVTSAVRTIFEKASDAFEHFSTLSGDVEWLIEEVRKGDTIDQLNLTLSSVNNFSEEADSFLTKANEKDTINNLNSALASLQGAGEQIESFMANHQGDIINTLDSLGQTSRELGLTLGKLDPILTKVEQSEFLNNLDELSANAVELTANLRDFSAQLNDPDTIVQLQQILDSARFVFENVNKVTSDIDELTGDPQLRQDLIRLIRGLTNLVSSTQQLQQQVQYAQDLNRLALKINSPQLSENIPPVPAQPTPSQQQP